MGKQQQQKKKKNKNPLSVIVVILSIPASVAALLGLFRLFGKWLEPNLAATANGGCWKVPVDVDGELKAMVQLDTMCSNLGTKFRQLGEILVDPNSRKAFAGAREVADKIAGTIKALSPYEAYDVRLLRALYTIEIKNNSGESSNTLVLETPDAKYVDFEVVGGGKTTTRRNLRGHECRILPLGRIGPGESVFINAWVIRSVSNEASFKIGHEGYRDVPIYMKMPVGKVADWLNRPRHTWIALLTIVLTVCTVGILSHQKSH